MPKRIKELDMTRTDESAFMRRCVDAIILTQDQHILLQERDANTLTYPNCLAAFGGGIEADETPLQTLVRELKEELGATVNPAHVIALPPFTELITQYSELIYPFFWHDQLGTITGCYEGRARYYSDCASAYQHPKMMDDVRWLLQLCQARQLLK